MNRRAKRILRWCDTRGRGLEIGPSFNPIAPKREGFNVAVMDHMNREGLIAKYRDHTNMPPDYENLIEPVDYVWTGQPYTALIRERFDYIISAHLLEHIPDLIGHLNDCCDLLKEGGVYSLAVPDSRYSFDLRRPVTTAEMAVSRKGDRGYRPDVIVEYVEQVVSNDGRVAWDKLTRLGDVRPLFTPEQMAMVRAAPEEQTITDLHISVFTPRSFRRLMDELYAEGEIRMPLMLVDEDTPSGEFFAVFRKGGNPAQCRFHALPAWKVPLYRARKRAAELLRKRL